MGQSNSWGMFWPTISAILLMILGVVAARAQSRIRLAESKGQSDIQTEAQQKQSPYRLFEQQLALKDADLKVLQAKLFSYLDSQTMRNEKETAALTSLATKVEAQTAALTLHTEASARRANEIHNRLNGMGEDLARLAGTK
jgi:hypothetical protein